MSLALVVQVKNTSSVTVRFLNVNSMHIAKGCSSSNPFFVCNLAFAARLAVVLAKRIDLEKTDCETDTYCRGNYFKYR